MSSPEVYAFETLRRRYGLSKAAALKAADAAVDDALRAILRRHVVAPAAIGGALGAGMGLYRGGKDILFDREPEANPLVHPLAEMARGGVRGAGLGVGVNAGVEGLRWLGRQGGVAVPSAADLGQAATRYTPFRVVAEGLRAGHEAVQHRR